MEVDAWFVKNPMRQPLIQASIFFASAYHAMGVHKHGFSVGVAYNHKKGR